MEEPPPIVETKPPEPQLPTMSLPARLLNVFAIPGDVFDEIKKAPISAGNWLMPAVLLILAGCVGAWLVYSQPAIQQQMREINDQFIQKMVEKGRITKEQAESQREVSEASAKIGPFAGAVIAPLITPFWWGLLLWLVGTKVFKANFPFMKAVEVAGLAAAISILGSILTTLLSISLGDLFASPSPELLVKNFNPQKPSHSFLAVANVMTFWVLAVRAIGLARLSGVRFMRAAAWVFGIWAGLTSFLMGVGFAIRAAFGF